MSTTERDLARQSWIAAHNALEEALLRKGSPEEVEDARKVERRAWALLQAVTPEGWHPWHPPTCSCSGQAGPAGCDAHPWMRDVLAAAALARAALMDSQSAMALASAAEAEARMSITRSRSTFRPLDLVYLLAAVLLMATGSFPVAFATLLLGALGAFLGAVVNGIWRRGT